MKASSPFGELTPTALARLDRWLGRFLTEASTEGFDPPDDTPNGPALRRTLAEGARLVRNPAARLALLRSSGGRVLLFVNGEEHPLPASLVPLGEHLVAGISDPDRAIDLLASLAAAGAARAEEP